MITSLSSTLSLFSAVMVSDFQLNFSSATAPLIRKIKSYNFVILNKFKLLIFNLIDEIFKELYANLIATQTRTHTHTDTKEQTHRGTSNHKPTQRHSKNTLTQTRIYMHKDANMHVLKYTQIRTNTTRTKTNAHICHTCTYKRQMPIHKRTHTNTLTQNCTHKNSKTDTHVQT